MIASLLLLLLLLYLHARAWAIPGAEVQRISK